MFNFSNAFSASTEVAKIILPLSKLCSGPFEWPLIMNMWSKFTTITSEEGTTGYFGAWIKTCDLVWRTLPCNCWILQKFNQDQRPSEREGADETSSLNETCQMWCHFNGKAALPSHPDSCFISRIPCVHCEKMLPLPPPHTPQLTPTECGVLTGTFPLPPLLDKTHNAGYFSSLGNWSGPGSHMQETVARQRVSLGFRHHVPQLI